MSKNQIEREISAMENKLRATRAAYERDRGAVRDVLQLVIPMMEDQLKIMRQMLDELSI